MDNTELISSVINVSDAWGGLKAKPKLVKNRENIVLDVTLNSGQRAAFRFHRPGYQSSQAIKSELMWMEALTKQNFPCPSPIRALNKDLIVETKGLRTASIIKWVKATELKEKIVTADENELISIFKNLGKITAELHNITDGINTNSFVRHKWDEEEFFSDNPAWGRYWENPSLSKQESEFIYKIKNKLRKTLGKIHNGDKGLIHADLLEENILVDTQKMWIIDFDDCGFGFREYDLATILIQHFNKRYFNQAKSALIEAYNKARNKFQTDTNTINFFIMVRSLVSCGWGISRAPLGSSVHREQADRALSCLELFNSYGS